MKKKLQPFSIKDFKNELRLICSDVWGTPVETWFEVCAHLHYRKIEIPVEWEYTPHSNRVYVKDVREKDNYFYELFKQTTTEDLLKIGKFLFRYCQFLEYKEMNY